MGRISLNGTDWLCKPYYGEDWRWRNAHKPDTRDTRHWKPGSVPGSVHHDLWMAGEIPNPYFERNSLLLEWIPARTWLYKKSFFVDEALRGEWVQLRFEGVDYEAEFFLNGESLGVHQGMYTPTVFEVSERLRYGADNLIAVVIEAAPHEQPQVSRTSKVRTHKSRMTYWWDFCPRMIHLGIWDDVWLNTTGAVRIDDVFVRPTLTGDFQRVDVSVAIDLDVAREQAVEVETVLRLGEQITARQRERYDLPAGQTNIQHQLMIEQPALWWPNGYGEQPLYQAEVRVTADDGARELDRRVVRFGIRRIEFAPNETTDPTARPYTLVVNGRKIYIKGWNWVPLDVLYGVPRPDKLDHLLTLAARANINLLRVWGGGLIEKEAFYDRCDELGILVWQEFIQSSSGIENNPSDAPEFIEMMVREAEQIIPRKRNHPSLALWCGGNELSAAPEQPLDDSHPLLGALRAVVARLDPDRAWLPTSPSGRVFSNSLENIERDPTALHDVHGPWEYQGVTGQYTLYNRGSSLLHSEFGVEGITNLKTLHTTIAPEHQWPPTLDNPVWQHLGAWWNQQATWQAAFGEVGDIETLARATQFTQAEGLRYALEADRRRKYQNSGTLPWQFNEPYPMAACTSAVDYYGQPKPAYYAVARAYAPVHVSAKFPTIAWGGRERFEAEVWAHNSHLSAFRGASLSIRIVGMGGHVYSSWTESAAFEGNRATRLFAIDWSLDSLREDIFFLDLRLQSGQGTPLSHNRYAFTRAANLASLLVAPPTELRAQKEVDGDIWVVRVSNAWDQTGLNIWLEDSREVGVKGYAFFGDNYFCLLPGESRLIPVLWKNVPPAERGLTVRGWNTDVRRL